MLPVARKLSHATCSKRVACGKHLHQRNKLPSVARNISNENVKMSDCEVIAAAAYIILTQLKKKKRRRWWSRHLFADRNISQKNFWQHLNSDDGALFENFTRMSVADFSYLLKAVAPSISKEDTNYRSSIPASVRLLITLRFLASGDSYRSLMYLFKVSDSTISLIVPEVCQALVRALKDEIKVSFFRSSKEKQRKYNVIDLLNYFKIIKLHSFHC